MAISDGKPLVSALTGSNRPKYLLGGVDTTGYDHVIGKADARITLVEYGSYASSASSAVHEVIANLHTRFGDDMRYVFRHLPVHDNKIAREAAVISEYLSRQSIDFWDIHNELMVHGKDLDERILLNLAKEFGVDLDEARIETQLSQAEKKVDRDIETGNSSGAFIAPTFFINGRRYEGSWDDHSLTDAMLATPGHRLRRAAIDFVRWGPSSGIALLTMFMLALILANSPLGEKFEAFWQTSVGFQIGGGSFELPLIKWINDGLLTLFFLLVGLEIKREFTVGRLSSRKAATLPLAAAAGGILIPAMLYIFVAPQHLSIGWGTTISTDTAFAIALIVFLGKRVPIELRIFLTASAIIDDLVAILVVAFFYTSDLQYSYLIGAVVVTIILIILNQWRFYKPLPYVLLGVVLWFCLHDAGIHATLSGVILALLIPTRPPANLHAIMAQSQLILRTEATINHNFAHHGPSHLALSMLDDLHDKIESPADKLLRSVEPVSSYFVLPIFALANAGVMISTDVFEGNGPLMLAIILGLVVGKPLGVFSGAWLASTLKIADKPSSYSWRQLIGAGALSGIGFTMSIFIASEAFTGDDFAAAKIAIFIASFAAAIAGAVILWRQREM